MRRKPPAKISILILPAIRSSPKKDPIPYPEDGMTLEDLIGFTLLDQDSRTAGTIADVLDFSGNICLELSGSGALVPFHDDLLLDINPDNRTLTLRIDESLL